MKKEAEMKMETDAMNNTNGQNQDDEITKGVLAKLSSEILVTPKAETKVDMKFLPKVTPNGEKLNIFNHTSNLNMTMSSVILNGKKLILRGKNSKNHPKNCSKKLSKKKSINFSTISPT